MSVKLTPAQERALLWLPADGRWSAGIETDEEINVLFSLVEKGYAESKEIFFFGSVIFSLTPTGIEARAQLEARR